MTNIDLDRQQLEHLNASPPADGGVGESRRNGPPQ